MSITQKASVGLDKLASRVPFGWAGIIELAPHSARLRIEHLASCFQPVRDNTTAIVWHGDGISAFALQNQVDALVEPGSTHLRIPSVGPCQGIVNGWLFSPATAVPLAPESKSLPEAISYKLTSDFVERGTAAFTSLNGGWTAVIWDKTQRRAVFARDDVGFDVIYVALGESEIVFASDLRILRLAGLAAEYDEKAIAEFLHFLFVSSPRSVYKDVHCVIQGHALIVEPQGMRQQRFARRFVQGIPLADDEKVESATQEYLPPFEERLLAAVQDCIPKRGRIGLLMSAGKDSPALAIALKDTAPDRVVALTVASPDPRHDETRDAAEICKFLGIPHRVLTPQADRLIASFLRMVACQEQPMCDPAALPLFLAAGDFPEDVSVIWDGSGNDDYFGVVHEDDGERLAKYRQFRRVVPDFAWPLFLWAMQRGPERFASTAREWQKPLIEAFMPLSGWTPKELERLWQRDVGWSDTYLRELSRRYADEDWITLQTETLGSVWQAEGVIRKVTYAGRAVGLSIRMPFIDNRLAEFVHNLPQELQYRGNTNKTILRAYLAKHLPDELIQKSKRAAVSIHQLLLQSEQGLLLAWLRQAGLLQVFPSWSEASIARMLAEYNKRPNDYAHRMYALSLLSLWVAISRGRRDWDGLC